MMTAVLNILGTTPRARRRALWGIALILPNTLGLFVFFGIPVLMSFNTSLQEWNGIRPAVYIGLDNFERMASDPRFWNALTNTIQLLLMIVPIEMLLALGVALLLNQQRLKGRAVFRTIYFLPVVTSTVAASVVWAWIFQPRFGLLDMFIAPLGFTDIRWMTSPDLVLIPIAAVAIWQRLGFDMVLFLAGLQSIPGVLYEAAIIDGANRWQRFRYVTLPMLSPITFLVVVLAIIQGFQIFDQVFIMTARTVPGGVGGSATTLTYFLYDAGFVRSQFGYASSVAVVLFMIILSVTVVQLRLQRYWVYYESGEAR
jgi:multiple sugar transport system permease protein